MQTAQNAGVSLSKVRTTIAEFVAFTFIGYFTIGLALAVLPYFIYHDLGFSTMTAGVVISLQYITTFLFRGYAGGIVDKKGPKPAVLMGMIGFAVSGALLVIAYLCKGIPVLSLSLLIITRLTTGFAEGMIGASPINWAILAVGDEHTSKAISYNGIGSYGALAVGAPLGAILHHNFGMSAMAGLIMICGVIGYYYAKGKTPLKSTSTAPRQAFMDVFKIITPFGVCLALGGLGFGTISTFITLYYSRLGWQGAVMCLSIFSISFILGRLFFEDYINRYGGMKTAIFCLLTESIGLAILWQAYSPHIALAGAGIAGFGFSLVFPALGVEAVKLVPASNKGAALGGYGVFIDLSLGITGPLVGLVESTFGMGHIFMFSMVMVFTGFIIAILINNWQRKGEMVA
ncbi:MFS transporter [Chitinophaga sancti]|uniref:MFS transporter n=1 Tax=Chitinophaga sancti TaxID=1004 RepID=A0A1K1NVZ5_9BACT|nr:MFS transporter [Chitinophaga sancti]WQD60224.1 MFS transporter [Chitinophaga sancti]WQG87648.1 MFS transporter [Chitinophaga sancti]SFW39427.1 Predicted arabinose efflux permease, MFS family [Chitinophaga sancti]